MGEKSSLGPGKQTQKLGLVWRNMNKISQIINAYLYLPFFLLIILCIQAIKTTSISRTLTAISNAVRSECFILDANSGLSNHSGFGSGPADQNLKLGNKK
jgi:hypothetical protein